MFSRIIMKLQTFLSIEKLKSLNHHPLPTIRRNSMILDIDKFEKTETGSTEDMRAFAYVDCPAKDGRACWGIGLKIETYHRLCIHLDMKKPECNYGSI